MVLSCAHEVWSLLDVELFGTCRCTHREHIHLDGVVVLELDGVPKIG